VLVIDYQHLDPVEKLKTQGRSVIGFGRHDLDLFAVDKAVGDSYGNRDFECRTALDSIAVNIHRAPMEFHQMSHNRESQS
jgi:hypothetical protein